MNKRSALFCYSALPDYFLKCIITFAETFDIVCHVVSFPSDEEAPYELRRHHLVIHYNKVDLKKSTFINTFFNLKPIIAYIVGWIEKDYLLLAKKYRAMQIPVVMGLDNHWINSIRQQVGTALFKRKIHKAASHIWIPGIVQYEFARKLGFKPRQIITGLYSADVEHFAKEFENKVYHNILFVGRFEPYKRPLELYQIFKKLTRGKNKKWSLTMIGRGPCRRGLKDTENIKIIDFVQPEILIEYAKEASVFCLPSEREHWGVTVHEFCAAGKLLILSDQVGAASEFLIHGYNGLKFKSHSLDDLEYQLTQVFEMTDLEINEFQQKSYNLAKRITPEAWAYKLYSLV